MAGTIANMYTGTSIALAAADTSSGVRRLAVVDAIGEDHDGAAQPGTIREPLRRLANRIVQRRGAERRNRLQLGLAAVSSRVNGVTSDSRVSKVKTAASSCCWSSQLSTWRAASRASSSRDSMLPLTSNSSATLICAGVGPEFGDLPGEPAVEHLEVAHRQVLDEPALLVADHRVHADELDARLERGNRLVLGSQKARRRSAASKLPSLRY